MMFLHFVVDYIFLWNNCTSSDVFIEDLLKETFFKWMVYILLHPLNHAPNVTDHRFWRTYAYWQLFFVSYLF